MTSEDDFQRALDANPTDWQTRLVFADWLDERGDERAEGYRALGVLRLSPLPDGEYGWTRCDNVHVSGFYTSGGRVEPLSRSPRWREYVTAALNVEWFRLLRPHSPDAYWHDFHTRREAEDAAALAFAKLSADVRAELLTVGVGC